MKARCGDFGRLTALLLGAGALDVAASPAFAEHAQQSRFHTPDQAVEAFVTADRNDDPAALTRILGAGGGKLIHAGDPVADARSRKHFVSAYDESHHVEMVGAGKAVLIIGKEDWPMPIPLVQSPAGWRFDTPAGEQEILNRRIGRNELHVIETCRVYVQAQREYAALTKPAAGKPEYAQHIMSHEGQHDGLYWPAAAGETESPLGPLVAQARSHGYSSDPSAGTPTPYQGYYFHILTRRGSHAPGGAKNYLIDGHMIDGFGLLAYPARYGDSGVMTFMVDQDGIVYEKNLGADTGTLAPRLGEFDPDGSWRPAP